jgi:hypothetical protein
MMPRRGEGEKRVKKETPLGRGGKALDGSKISLKNSKQ